MRKGEDLEYIEAKTLIHRTKSSSWFGTEYNMNIYKGCNHGCIYCDSRSSCYRIDNFSNVRTKKDSLLLIRDELRRKVRKGVIGTGAMSDPYNPFEKNLELTRHAIELCSAYEFGIAIYTKSDLVVRDIDVLTELKESSPVIVCISISTSNDEIASKTEPGAPSPSRRFTAVKELSSAGICAGIILMPVLPFINDNEKNIVEVIEKAHAAGAKFIYPAFGVTVREGQRGYFYRELDKTFPGIREKYINTYGSRYSCTSPKAKRLWSVFTKECDKRGILYKMQDIISYYKRGYGDMQLSFY